MHRNIVTIGNLDPELHEWAKQESKRRKALGLPNCAFYHVVNDGLRLLRQVYVARDPKEETNG